MISRKRRRPNDKEERSVAAAREFEMTNSTMQQFLGPTQKSWMTSGGLPARSIARPSRPPPVSTAPASTVRDASSSRTTPAAGPEGSSLLSGLRENLASGSVVDQAMQHHPSNQESVVDTSNSNLAAPPQPLSESMDPLLPSPAPSDRSIPGTIGRREGSVAMSSPRPTIQEGTIGPPTDQTSDGARLMELAARYGGIVQLERELEKARRISTQQSPSTNSTPAPQNPSAQASPIQGNAASNRNQMPFLQPTRTINPLQSPYGQAPGAAQSPTTTSSPQPMFAPQESLTDAQLDGLLEILRHRSGKVNFSEGLTNEHKGFEDGRLLLLQDACIHRDLLYLVLHQVYCLRDVSTVHSAIKPSTFGNDQQRGFRALQDLIVPNSQMAPISLAWFSTFPSHPDLAFHNSVKYRESYQEALSCLGRLGAQWDNFLMLCQRGRAPPLVAMIESHLGVRSTVLQRVIFKAICRSLWLNHQDKCFETFQKFFQLNQAMSWWWDNRRMNSDPPSEVELATYHSKLISQYQSLFTTHHRHVQNQQPEHAASLVALLQVWTHKQMKITGNLALGNNSNLLLPQLNPNIQPAQQFQPTIQSPLTTQSLNSNRSRFPVGQVDMPNGRSNITSSQVQTSHQSQPQPRLRPQRTRSLQHFNEMNTISHLQILQSSPNVHGQTTPAMSSPRSFDAPPLAGSQNFQLRPSTQESTQPRQASAATPYLQQQQRSNNINANVNTIQPDSYYSKAIIREIIPAVDANKEPVLYAPANWRRNVVQHPPPDGSSLHQAHLRDSQIVQIDEHGGECPTTSLFAYVTQLLLNPFIIKQRQRNPDGYFQVPDSLHQQLPRDTFDVIGSPPRRIIRVGSRMIRLRCMKVYKGAISLAEWATRETTWPNQIAIMLNNLKSLEVRRKAEHGKDLPIDITSLVRRGENEVRFAISHPADALDANTNFAIGIEILEIADAPTIKQAVRNVPASKTRERIRKQLQNADDEIQILSRDLTVTVTDPFTSRVVEDPVRGRLCLHYECFDLDVFVQTRTPDVWRPEQFKCPICGSDARPQSLERDEWFVELVQELRRMGRMDASAVVVDEEARWKVREVEVEGESGDGTGRKRDGGGGKDASKDSVRKMSMMSEVIELD